MRILLIILFNLSLLSIHGQFTYFNELYGEFGDQETEITTNVEVIGDTIYMFGGLDNEVIPFSFLVRSIDLNGNAVNEEVFPSGFNSTLVGNGNAVSSTENNKFLFTQGASNDDTYGLAILYDDNLDTIWKKEYDLFPPFTYFRSNILENDGFVISGMHDIETPDIGSQAASFLLKIDNAGEIIWNKVIKEANGSIYINNALLKINDGYLLGGRRNVGLFTAMLTKTDIEGNVEWEYYANNFVDDEGEEADTREYRLTQLSNGDIVGAHMVWYEFAGGNPSPNNPNWWTSLHLSKINVEDSSLFWEHDFLTDYELRKGLLWKIIKTQDSGILAMGMQTGFEYTWLLKIDSIGNQEWFKTYPFDAADFEAYKPYDIEMTSDGGFVIVGEHYSLLEDNFKQSWVMKIDACGDVEWQGCDYVGIQESKKRQLKVYPNPTSDFITVEGEGLSNKTQVLIYNQLGQVVLNERLVGNNQLYIGQLRSGLYQSVLREDGAVTYSSKIVIEK